MTPAHTGWEAVMVSSLSPCCIALRGLLRTLRGLLVTGAALRRDAANRALGSVLVTEACGVGGGLGRVVDCNIVWDDSVHPESEKQHKRLDQEG